MGLITVFSYIMSLYFVLTSYLNCRSSPRAPFCIYNTRHHSPLFSLPPLRYLPPLSQATFCIMTYELFYVHTCIYIYIEKYIIYYINTYLHIYVNINYTWNQQWICLICLSVSALFHLI